MLSDRVLPRFGVSLVAAYPAPARHLGWLPRWIRKKVATTDSNDAQPLYTEVVIHGPRFLIIPIIVIKHLHFSPGRPLLNLLGETASTPFR